MYTSIRACECMRKGNSAENCLWPCIMQVEAMHTATLQAGGLVQVLVSGVRVHELARCEDDTAGEALQDMGLIDE